MIFKRIIKLGLYMLVLAAILFISSGHPDWVIAWVFLTVLMACMCINMIVLTLTNHETVQERIQEKGHAKRWDEVLISLIGILCFVGLFLAGFDQRFGWSLQIGLSLQILALAIFVLGDILFLWAKRVNKFFSSFVRIQEERGHHVVTSGPYRYVRHPGHVGALMMTCTPPLILGSLWALIPTGLAICLMVLRTVLEDRTLQEELNGYKDYAKRVRYRLLPAIW